MGDAFFEEEYTIIYQTCIHFYFGLCDRVPLPSVH